MKLFVVIGHPIGHSLSPLMHNTAFQLLGLPYTYEARDVDPSALESTIQSFKTILGGFNVTTPHKEAIIPFLDEISHDAHTIGSVNTVVNRNGTFIGYNTDIIGVERSLHPYHSNIDGQECIILGAGGAARSVTYVLTHSFKPKSIAFGALYPEQAQAIIKSLGNTKVKLDVIDFSDPVLDTAIKNCTLIVNATTVGMFPNITESPVHDQRLLTSRHIIFDLVYRPLKTRLLEQAEGAGAKTIGGLTMFLHQGASAFQLWTGKEMPMEKIRHVLEEKLIAEA